jgi:ABC-type multidrug transport system fused ATPase/permease subunit
MSATLLKPQQTARPDDLARDSPDPQHGAHPASHNWGAFAQAYLGPFWRRFTLLGVLLVVSTLLQTLGPQLAQRFIDAQRAHAVETALLALAIGAVVAATLNALTGVGAAFLGQDIGWASTNRIREDLAGWLLRQDMSFHNLRTPGELIERIDGDLTTLSDTFSVLLIQVVGGALLMVGTLVALFLANWVMGLVLTAFALVALVALLIMRSVAVPAGVNEREASAQFLGFLEERLAGVEDLRANGAGAYVMRRFYQAARVWFRKSVIAWTRRVSVFVVTLLIFGLGLGLTMGMSAYLYLVAHSITIGVVYLFVQYMFLLQGPIEQISQQMQQFQKAASSLIRVRELLSLQSGIVDGQAQLPGATAGESSRSADERRGLGVSFDHVTFTYPTGEQPTLRDVAFTLEPGQVMGLVGRTGSGKTTISRLLFRLYDVGEGAVRLDGVDVRDLPLAALHQRVGLVTQDVQLFQASVRDNVSFFDDSIPDARIIEVFERLGMSEWLARLPDGLNTWLEASGGGLSAGEAQLLAFVRVFLRDPGLVILDEPSSRLDLATERMIEQGMRALLAGRTGIIIAHRLATVRRADVILTLGAGQVLELGEREALERQADSHFAALLRMGLEDEETIDQDQEGALV